MQKNWYLFLSHYLLSVDHSNSLLRVLTNLVALYTEALIHWTTNAVIIIIITDAIIKYDNHDSQRMQAIEVKYLYVQFAHVLNISRICQWSVLHLLPGHACNTWQNNILYIILSKTSSSTDNPSPYCMMFDCFELYDRRIDCVGFAADKNIEYSFERKSDLNLTPSTEQHLFIGVIYDCRRAHVLTSLCHHVGNAKIQRPEHTGRQLPWTDCFHRNIQ